VRVRLDKITKSYGRVTALRDVSLEIEPGQLVAVLGFNGAGKTTLLRALAGIVGLNKGAILYDGELFRRDRLDLRRRLSFLPDFPPMFPALTVAGQIGLWLRLYGRDGDAGPVSARVLDWLGEFDLLSLADAPVFSLSRGQAYKTALVALRAVDPELWLLDEPFASGMDPQGIAAFRAHARAAAEAGRTVIYSTQILDIAEKFSDRVCVLERGEVRAWESVEQLRADSGGAAGGVLEDLFRRLRTEA
jgi:ABC-2 type transport system ATP-binding protein